MPQAAQALPPLPHHVYEHLPHFHPTSLSMARMAGISVIWLVEEEGTSSPLPLKREGGEGQEEGRISNFAVEHLFSCTPYLPVSLSGKGEVPPPAPPVTSCLQRKGEGGGIGLLLPLPCLPPGREEGGLCLCWPWRAGGGGGPCTAFESLELPLLLLLLAAASSLAWHFASQARRTIQAGTGTPS